MSSNRLSVLTWNIHFGSASMLDALAELATAPDVVTLQEVTVEHAQALLNRLRDLGYESVCSSDPDSGKPRYGNVIAARAEITLLDLTAHPFPYPQLAAHARVDTPDGSINVVTVHVPNGSGYGWEKIDTLDALKQLTLRLKGEPLVVTGDFNEPRYAMQDGQVVTWGQEKFGGRWEVEEGKWEDGNGIADEWGRWDKTVRWFFESPEESGIRNAFWDFAGRGTMEASHFSRGAPRWFDHVFISDDFRVDNCRYLHAFREEKYSDHSALLAVLRSGSGSK